MRQLGASQRGRSELPGATPGPRTPRDELTDDEPQATAICDLSHVFAQNRDRISEVGQRPAAEDRDTRCRLLALATADYAFRDSAIRGIDVGYGRACSRFAALDLG